MVVVAAIVATAVLNQIAAILKDEAMEEMKKTRSLETEVKNLETYLIAIQSTLEDAEQRQMVDGAMGLYLQDLETVSYEIEDVLEEWERRRPVSMIDEYLTGKNFATIDLDGLGLSDPLLSSDGARHLTIILPSSVTRELILSDRLRLCNVSKLRGLVIFSSEGNRVVQADDLLQLFKKNELLRVLDLGWDDSSDLCQKILRKKDKWKYLKHLNLFGCKTIQELPDIICCFGVGSYPKGIRGLTSLRTLTDIIARVGRNNPREFCLGDLENLNNLRGNLRLKLIGNAIDVQEVDKAKLQNKTRLRDIKIYLDGGIDLAAATIALNRHPSTSVQDMITWEVWSSPPASMLLATMKMLGFR
ncbi:hypothetical protein V6N12_046992 [Hibiscus sabdariffa]|uniref:Disease resistance N-terminal domain-containing protein n=1 Tax=Hibiscus sabdariffa TaxID=183260 RepID=A0ABR2BCA0_9ROSI